MSIKDYEKVFFRKKKNKNNFSEIYTKNQLPALGKLLSWKHESVSLFRKFMFDLFFFQIKNKRHFSNFLN